jgi:hypothetical protein
MTTDDSGHRLGTASANVADFPSDSARAEDRKSRAPESAGPPAGSFPPGRDARGRFVSGNTLGEASRFPPGNFAALAHSLRAVNLPPELAHLAADVEDFVAGCLVDEGDAADVPTRRRALLTYRARVHRRILQVDSMLELRGLVDKRGKLRVAWLQQLAALIGVAKATDSLLGLQRRAKRVPTLAEYVASRYGGARAAGEQQDGKVSTVADGEGER